MTSAEGPAREWRATGHQQRVDEFSRKPPEYDPRLGEHCWVVVVMFGVQPTQWIDPALTPMLDRENLFTLQGPRCYFCERLYTRRLAARRCPGDPK